MDDDETTLTPKLSPPLHNTSAPRDGEPDDVKKLLEWQQKRMARKLQGQQESLGLHLSQLVCHDPRSFA
jgi:outer membrane protein insertion porin family